MTRYIERNQYSPLSFIIKIMLFNFFKILKRRSTHLLLPSCVMKCRKPMPTSLFILKGVKPILSLLRNKLKIWNMLLTCCCVAFPTLFICHLFSCRLTFSCMYVHIRSVYRRFGELLLMFCESGVEEASALEGSCLLYS